jgi:glycosyltransferase involved in cell wall biosynthesis
LAQNYLPKKLLFVDDHSNDDGAKIIYKKFKTSSIPFEIITLTDEMQGKKHAIMSAVHVSKTQYCQALDADVWFDIDFYQNLPEPKNYEMQILPVRMIGSTWFTKLFELEYGSFQILQAMVKSEKPLMASGANLIFSRESYLSYNQLDTHAHRSSGDDQYALAQFIEHKRNIQTYFDGSLAVFTKTPQSFSELLNQRIRWMGNNTQGNDWRASSFAALIFLLNSLFIIFLIQNIITLDWINVLLWFTAKVVYDVVIYSQWFERNRTWGILKFLPVLILWYPFYLIALLLSFSIKGSQVKWKMRKVKT